MTSTYNFSCLSSKAFFKRCTIDVLNDYIKSYSCLLDECKKGKMEWMKEAWSNGLAAVKNELLEREWEQQKLFIEFEG